MGSISKPFPDRVGVRGDDFGLAVHRPVGGDGDGHGANRGGTVDPSIMAVVSDHFQRGAWGHRIFSRGV